MLAEVILGQEITICLTVLKKIHLEVGSIDQSLGTILNLILGHITKGKNGFNYPF